MKELNYSNNSIIDYLMFQKSVLKINIHYETLMYEYIIESPFLGFIDFLLDIGYTFGLFFG